MPDYLKTTEDFMKDYPIGTKIGNREIQPCPICGRLGIASENPRFGETYRDHGSGGAYRDRSLSLLFRFVRFSFRRKHRNPQRTFDRTGVASGFLFAYLLP
jgi:hypothetical protein